MHTIKVQIPFCAGHRILGHQGKCRWLHGHNYLAEIEVSSKVTDDLGMVMDFSEIKTPVKQWVDANWDHNMILHPQDPLIAPGGPWEVDPFDERRPFIMPEGSQNPTAENMAKVLFLVTSALLTTEPNDQKIKVYPSRVSIWETPTSCGIYERDL